ncbi:MAG: hypothetical protein WC792_06560 [Candidatus Micrarchaeia archaeon]|jgi:DNA replication initiation complex subunit (GINS family)
MELSFEALRKVLAAEKTDTALSALPSNFYDQYAALLSTQRGELQNNWSHDANTRYQNNLKLFKELAERRESKIVLKAFRDAKTGNVSSDGLCPHESDLYSNVFRDCLSARESFEGVAAGKPVVASSAALALASSNGSANGLSAGASIAPAGRKVFVLTDVPEFVTPTGSTIGPLKSGEVVELEGDSAALLIRRQAARDA